MFFFFSSRRRHTRSLCDWSSDVCSSDLILPERKRGSAVQFIGADFSYGVGKDNDEAEMRLKRHKAERKASGHLERGELRGIRKKQNPKDVHPPGLSTFHSVLDKPS